MALTYSVVIPVYNAEKYLESCVNSVLEQQTSAGLEIVLVDDGSVDRSPEICDGLAANVPCVKVIHQNNRGVSAARNAGIEAAGGTYVLFLDADDCWDAGLLQQLDMLLHRQPDLIEFGFETFGEEVPGTTVLPAVSVSGKSGMEYFEAHKLINTMPIASSCTAAFRRELLQTCGIRFPVGVRYGEDFIFHIHCMKAAASVFTVGQPLYRYRRNAQSATHILTVDKMRDILQSCAQMYRMFPCAMLANYYCMKIVNLARLSPEEAAQLKELLRENRHILRQVSGRKMRFAAAAYGLFGWYGASRLIQACLGTRHVRKE